MTQANRRHRRRSTVVQYRSNEVARARDQLVWSRSRHSISSPIGLPEIVKDVYTVLGGKLTAYIGRARHADEVQEWITGKWLPPDVEARMRIASDTVSLLSEYEKPDVIQAWFIGQNPQLDGRAPLRVLREGELNTLRDSLLKAATAFLACA